MTAYNDKFQTITFEDEVNEDIDFDDYYDDEYEGEEDNNEFYEEFYPYDERTGKYNLINPDKIREQNDDFVGAYLQTFFVEEPVVDEGGYKSFICKMEDDFYKLPKPDTSKEFLMRYKKNIRISVVLFNYRSPQLIYNSEICEIPVTASTLIDVPDVSNMVEQHTKIIDGYNECADFLLDFQMGKNMEERKQPN